MQKFEEPAQSSFTFGSPNPQKEKRIPEKTPRDSLFGYFRYIANVLSNEDLVDKRQDNNDDF